MNQRDAQKLETRRQLSAAAIELFAERGYDDTRIDDIAARVGVSSRTFFHHFPTKEFAVFPDHNERVEALTALLAVTPPDQDPFDIVFEQVRFGLTSTISSPMRTERYRLISRVDALRERDALNDLDYEAALSEYLVRAWSGSGDATLIAFRARLVAGSTMAIARAALTAWIGDPSFDPIAETAAALESLRGARP